MTTYSCARCHAPMSPLSNCRQAPEGLICMPCATAPDPPVYLRHAPGRIEVVVPINGTFRIASGDDPKQN